MRSAGRRGECEVASLRALHPLVGTWRSRGRTAPAGDDPGMQIAGTDSYEWLGDGFLIHRVD